MKNEVVLQLRLSRGVVALMVLAASLMLGVAATTVFAQDEQTTINACKNLKKGTLRIVEDPTTCTSKETPISWNQQGPKGDPGPEGPPGPDGGDAGSLDGKDSTEFLGKNEKAADSDKLDGKDSTGFIQGKGNIYHGRSSVPEGPSVPNTVSILNVPGFGQLYGQCGGNTDGYSLHWINFSGVTHEAWWFNKDGVDYADLADTATINLTPFSTTDYVVVMQVGTGGNTATVTATGHWASNSCKYSAQAVTQIN